MTQNKNASDARDPTIADLHRARESLVTKFNGDLAELTADAQRRQIASGRKIIRRSKRIVETGAATH
jgi:hypothetical protein